MTRHSLTKERFYENINFFFKQLQTSISYEHHQAYKMHKSLFYVVTITIPWNALSSYYPLSVLLIVNRLKNLLIIRHFKMSIIANYIRIVLTVHNFIVLLNANDFKLY